MTQQYKIAMIGCGRPLRTEGATGFGMAHRHIAGFKRNGKCELVAVADISRENAEAFIQEHNPKAAIYEDYGKMVEEIKPDIVSICLWPHLHAQVIRHIAPMGIRAIHCEKPMDIHWDDCLEMVDLCHKHNVQLTINHQRRFNKPFLKAKELIDSGVIGDLERMESAWHNFFDAGTHWLDMLFYFNNDVPATWAMGQIDIRGAKRSFGALQAGQGMVTFRFENGVRATYFCGLNHEDIGCMIRVFCQYGIIEITSQHPWLRLLEFKQPGWNEIDTGESIHDDAAIYRGIDNLIECLESGETPLLSGDYAIRATEIIFAAHESARKRCRVDLPLPPMRSPLLEMVEHGELQLELPKQ
ncbi:MAG: Gfo/Idh/MocA family protein [Candidatus Sumerlaeia bacterium]